MKTAVSWLIDHMKEYGFDLSHHEREIEQAKEMEKQQIIQASERAQNTDFYVEFEGSEDYFDKTYKKP